LDTVQNYCHKLKMFRC